jgi:hypothetical protein
MKKINNILLELYKDKYQLLVLSILYYVNYWLQPLFPGELNVIQGSGGLIVMGAIATTALVAGAITKIQADKSAKVAQSKASRAEKKLTALENSRQEILNQGEKIRDMKSQIFNPYANVAVAMKGTELQIEQTDEALANTLDTINQSGTGAGGATALAMMAAKGKAQIGASIENQEAQNQKLRMQGESQMINQKMQLEQAALGAEEAAYGRQETRDVAQLNRLAAQQQNYEMQAMALKQAGNEAMMAGVSSASSAGSSAGGMMSDRRLKNNIELIGYSPSGLNIYKFKYKDTKYGKGFFQGVMSDEIPSSAVKNINGYDMVDYSLIDVEFKNI